MLKDQKTINLEIDKVLYTPIFAKQNDSARYLLFNLLNNGVPFSLVIVGRQNATVRVYATKPDGTKIFNDLTVIDAANGQAELQLTTQMLAVVGNVNMELVIYEGTSILSTTVFTLEVQATNRSDSAVVSTNEFSALTVALANADSAKQAYIAGASALETTYAPRLSGLEAKGFIPDNLLIGSDFEKPIANGFTVASNTTIALSTEYCYHGSQSLKISFTGPKGGVRRTIDGDYFNACKGKKVTFSLKIKGNTSAIGKNIYATIVTSSNITTDSAPLTISGDWQTIYVTTTIPSNITYFNLYIGYGTLVAGDIIYADYAKLELNDTVGIWKPNSEDILDSLLDKQTKTDANLKTVDKTTTGAINELKATGEISYFARSTAPTGWLKANGALISRTTYANLFSAIGTTFGVGDGSTTFALPDLRGLFVRGWDDGAGTDPGRTFGTYQSSQFETHAGHIIDRPASGTHILQVGNINATAYANGSYNIQHTNEIQPAQTYLGGTETRPANRALLACIRY